MKFLAATEIRPEEKASAVSCLKLQAYTRLLHGTGDDTLQLRKRMET